jgi:hypothetical protein
VTKNLIVSAEDMLPAPDEWEADDELISSFDCHPERFQYPREVTGS